MYNLRRRHASELASLADQSASNYSSRVSSFEVRAQDEIGLALSRRRDSLLQECRHRVVKGVEVLLNLQEEEGERRRNADREQVSEGVRVELAKRVAEYERALGIATEREGMRKGLESRVEQIKADNDDEARRVFGELARALEVGAAKNVAELTGTIKAEMMEKEANLIAHGEGVVAEAMERISHEMADGERSDLLEIRREGDERRVEMFERTRLEGQIAVESAMDAERSRIRDRKEAAVEGLRSRLQGKAIADLTELEEAMDEDLRVADTY